ncbi:MAG TPA: exosortase-associated EpsI family protein [Kiritimatiellia bacterium]|nr:exosortase-associated EpsI family protein [Kiritimatiellia bacterium]
MEIRTLKPYLTLLCLMVATSLALAFSVDVTMEDQSGITPDMPDQVGQWTGDDILFCLNPQHQKVFSVSELEQRETCPDCNGKLGTMSLIEKQMLPADTIVRKKRYTHADGRQIFATIVMTGRERASIHRPERCLVGQGSEIVRTHNSTVPMANRSDLGVKILDMLHRGTTSAGQPFQRGSYYAYWFVGHDRETPSHYARQFWMAADRIFNNKAHRWSYIAISGHRDLSNDAYRQEIREFISQMYPKIIIEESLM